MHSNGLLYNAQEVYKPDVDFLQPSLFCRATAFFRITPAAFLGGVQKGGTTSLYHALVQHPQVIPSKFKEVFYYGNTVNYNKGLMHYKQYFASQFYRTFAEWRSKKPMFSIDGSTNTFDSNEAPARILKDNPNAKIIFILRNPTNRAFSHYNMAVKRGWELADFEQALDLEAKRIEEGKTHPAANSLHNYAYYRLGYKSRGVYVEHIKRWLSEFPNKNIHIISSEEFFNSPGSIYKSLCQFLEIETDADVKFQKLNEGTAESMDPKIKLSLDNYFKPHNEALFQLLNRRFDW